MKRNLQTFAVPASIVAGVLIGCASPRVIETTDPTRPSIVQVSEGYDTVGRRWEVQTKPPVAPAPAPVAVVVAPKPVPVPVPAAVGAPAPVVQTEVFSRTESGALNFTGTITDIDLANREMTLKGPEGRLETFVVDKDVRRFNEAKVGDKVTIDYHLGVTAEVRKPTPDEEQNPLLVMETESRAGLDADPAARGMRKIRAVVTIEALDRSAQTVTVKGPRGKHFTTRVDHPSRLEKVRIGDTIVMTFTESTAVSLKPAESE